MGLISLSSRFDPELQRIRDLAIPLARRVLVDQPAPVRIAKVF